MIQKTYRNNYKMCSCLMGGDYTFFMMNYLMEKCTNRRYRVYCLTIETKKLSTYILHKICG